MLTPIDKFLYSDNCAVIKLDSEYIFPIYKNGSTSLYKHCHAINGTVLSGENLKNINDDITVIVRDPIERFKSGVATVLYNLKNKHPDLDINTVEFLLKKYRYLDVHYMPQFHWLLNLARFVNPTVNFQFKSMSYLAHLTESKEVPAKTNDLKFDYDLWQDLYLQLDIILYNQIGNKLTFKELMEFIKQDKDSGYNDITNIPFSIVQLLK